MSLPLNSLSSTQTRDFQKESFLESERPKIANVLNEHTSLIPNIAKIIAEYAIQGKAFGSADWERVFGIRVEHIELDDRFYKFWFANDALDQTRLNCDTHLPPILIPQKIQEITATPLIHRHRFARCIDIVDYNFEALKKIVKNSLACTNSSLFCSESINNRPEPSHWVVARKELFIAQETSAHKFIKDFNQKTHSSYEELPTILDISTVAIINYIVTGERYLENPKPHWTFCKEIETNNIYIAGCPSTEKNDIIIASAYIDPMGIIPLGIAGIQKFSAK
ncbi:MAG: hypothetical protein H0X29_10495 [Parachlamydiaceae bacterium]|nr:hypothetical protein [Parachlamydiaceae bacterium]